MDLVTYLIIFITSIIASYSFLGTMIVTVIKDLGDNGYILDYDSDNHVEYLKVNLDNTNPEYSVTYDFVFGYVNTISLKFNVKNNTIS